MLPLMLDLAEWPVLLVGGGPAALKRLDLLEQSGARRLAIHAPDPLPEMRARAGARLVERLPDEAEIAAARLLFVADLPEPEAARLAVLGRAHRVLVNVEDVVPLCDAYAMATVRRGQLVLAVSTEGRSPAVAARLRRQLAERYGPEWAARLDAVAALRDRLRAEGRRPAEVMAETNAWLDAQDRQETG
ncbi:siroheme synthase [Roseomonas sp. NAR14]|uniref:precorrin-2 dehydrogenase n=1 Tax=Roseomonas acroporae TaxID=2937791 RepID=A0A9X1YHE3_9PROT|nr:NAD(P)-dependent oxidoreductase [Roseomonas acroporae]MCK8786211.1 siroheme synthase [Roseomonas acroporae]